MRNVFAVRFPLLVCSVVAVAVMTKSQSKEDLIGSKEQLRGDRKSFVLPPDYVLSPTEKKFLLLAERGDCASVQRYVRIV